jgi:DNA-binding transcriptional LysR family regulator
MHRITIKQLAIFAAVAKDESVTKAANEVGLSQAAVSQALADIEHLLDRPLFDRVGRKLALNGEGKSLLPQALDILGRVKAIEAPMHEQPFSLRIGASLTICDYYLPPALIKLLSAHPHGYVNVQLGNSEQVANALKHFEIDVGFLEQSHRYPDLVMMPWKEDPLVLVAAKDHPLSKEKEVRPEQLSEASWVLREPASDIRQKLHSAEKLFYMRHISLEMTGNQAIVDAVAQGLGISCLPASIVEKLTPALTVLNTPWLDLNRTLSVVVHRNKLLTQSLQKLLTICGVKVK